MYTPSSPGGRWRQLSLVCAATLLSIFSAMNLHSQTRITSTVLAASDDLEEVIATGAVDFTSSDLELTSEGAGIQVIGLRFPGLSIPQGAIITGAAVQFTTDETTTEATTLTFRGEASDNSATFANAPFAVSSRPVNSAAVSWTVAQWNILQEQGADQRSADLKSIVQEIVSRSGWSSGNAISMIVTGSGKRVAESQEGAASGAAGHAASQAATLIIDYIVPTTFSVRVNAGTDDAEENIGSGAIDLTSSDLELITDAATQYVGLRFAGISIPTGATIASAHIQFSTDELNSEATALTIRGQAIDNAPTFTATTGNISGRTLTTASASWSPAPWTVIPEAGTLQRTPDLSAVIQEIVGRAGWASGNALVIRISGSGKRVAESFDKTATGAPQLVVRYYSVAPTTAPIGGFPVPRTATWKYLDNGTFPGATWKDSTFNDAAWKFGPAELGFGDGDEATTVGFGPDPANKHITTWFRHTFTIANRAMIDSLRLSLLRDDGAVVYLNGNEIFRSNMPAGSIAPTTLASSNVAGTDESAFVTATIGKQFLVDGRNYLSVEIHQDAPTSSDISFNFELSGVKYDAPLVGPVSAWEYRDGSGLPPADWYRTPFADASWKYGAAPLGYGNGNEATTIGYGANAAAKNMAAYFRRSFEVVDTAGFGSLELRLRSDDGAIVYLNGAELLRTNMPAGPVGNTTAAIAYIEGADEATYQTYYIPKALLKIGGNLIAAEVHQNSPTSTDLAFDMQLTLRVAANALTPLGTGTVVTCDPASSPKIGCFTSVRPAGQVQTFVYPQATHRFQKIVKSGQDRYTGTSSAIPGGNDFTGFVPAGTSSTRGHLSINHENSPGGVSIVDLAYNESRRLWENIAIAKVDFTQLVQTNRNCSGTVTPWNTVITSEEVYSTGDANADGYHDIGWNVEIDPVTGKVRDYDGDGKPDKLWAAGRMSHENVVVASDSMTLYQGEDGGTGCVYKFVASQKMRMDAGILYVLKRDAPTSTTGTWVRVPNTTQAERNTSATLAGTLGGYRFGGVEDVEIGPKDGLIYFTEKGRGDIWRFRDDGATVSGLEVFVSNRSYPITHESGVTNESWGTGIDNLAFDDEGNLWSLQDGGRNHLWVVRPGHTTANPKIELFATTPSGSEPTGITFSPDFRFMFFSFQHPNTSNTAAQKDAADSSIIFNQPITIVMARKEHLGAGPVAPRVALGNDVVVCEGTPVVLKNSDRDAQNIWSDGSTDSVLRVTRSGEYYVTAIGNNGLIARDTVSVTFEPLPTFSLGPDRMLCPGNTTTITAPVGDTFVWDDGSNGRSRIISKPGTYFVTVTNVHGCRASDTINIGYLPQQLAELGRDRTICSGESVTLNPGPGFTLFYWSDNSTQPTLTVSKPGRYWVTAAAPTGCVSTDTVVICMTASPSLGEDLEFCEGSSAVLTPGAGHASYAWSTGATTPTLRVMESGTYWVRVADENGCAGYDTVSVKVTAAPAINLGRDTTICRECFATLDAGAGFARYRWSTGDTTRTIVVDREGSYGVTAYTPLGCTGHDEIHVGFESPISGIAGEAGNKRFTVETHPNPFGNDLTVSVKLSARAELKLEIYDLSGRKVTTLVDGSRDAGNHDFRLDASRLEMTSGAYLLKVMVDGREYSRKVMRK